MGKGDGSRGERGGAEAPLLRVSRETVPCYFFAVLVAQQLVVQQWAVFEQHDVADFAAIAIGAASSRVMRAIRSVFRMMRFSR